MVLVPIRMMMTGSLRQNKVQKKTDKGDRTYEKKNIPVLTLGVYAVLPSGVRAGGRKVLQTLGTLLGRPNCHPVYGFRACGSFSCGTVKVCSV